MRRTVTRFDGPSARGRREARRHAPSALRNRLTIAESGLDVRARPVREYPVNILTDTNGNPRSGCGIPGRVSPDNAEDLLGSGRPAQRRRPTSSRPTSKAADRSGRIENAYHGHGYYKDSGSWFRGFSSRSTARAIVRHRPPDEDGQRPSGGSSAAAFGHPSEQPNRRTSPRTEDDQAESRPASPHVELPAPSRSAGFARRLRREHSISTPIRVVVHDGAARRRGSRVAAGPPARSKDGVRGASRCRRRSPSSDRVRRLPRYSLHRRRRRDSGSPSPVAPATPGSGRRHAASGGPDAVIAPHRSGLQPARRASAAGSGPRHAGEDHSAPHAVPRPRPKAEPLWRAQLRLRPARSARCPAPATTRRAGRADRRPTTTRPGFDYGRDDFEGVTTSSSRASRSGASFVGTRIRPACASTREEATVRFIETVHAPR